VADQAYHYGKLVCRTAIRNGNETYRDDRIFKIDRFCVQIIGDIYRHNIDKTSFVSTK